VAEAAVTRPAPAKVNLDLLVTGRRADGYHELDSLVVFVGIGDIVSAGAGDELTLIVEGPFAGQVPTDDSNLAVRAAQEIAWAARCEPRATLRLVKKLPVAAGLGGGSSDAAAALLALDELWGLGLSGERLRDIGLTIGADVPVCLYGQAARMRGVGERLDPVRGLPELPLLLVNPGVEVATRDVFRGVQLADEPEGRPPFPSCPSALQLAAWLGLSRNDLEAPAIAIAPEIGEALELLRSLRGCHLARMSGSGASCWALFANGRDLLAAESELVKARPRWWRWAGVIPAGA
jgi:4-diphosphocytidyl-2-C-methyl-D-erythritol kinase